MQQTLQWNRNTYYISERERERERESVCMLCSLNYPTFKAHVPYCHLWSVRLYNIFPHYPTNGTIFERNKKSQNTKCAF